MISASEVLVKNALWIAIGILIVWLLLALFKGRDNDPGDEGGVAV